MRLKPNLVSFEALAGRSCPFERIFAFLDVLLCRAAPMDVSPRGLRAFRQRPASRRQRSDLVTLAYIKEQSRLSLGSYGRPRMAEELKEIGLQLSDLHATIADYR